MTEIVEDLLLLLVIEIFAANMVPKFHFARLAAQVPFCTASCQYW